MSMRFTGLQSSFKDMVSILHYISQIFPKRKLPNSTSRASTRVPFHYPPSSLYTHMPLLRPLLSSGPHRLAAVALYRALLSQSKALPTPNPELLNIIRNRFKQSQHVNSHRRLRLSFEAGYEAIDLLDRAAAGDVSAAVEVDELVGLAPARAKDAKPMPVGKRRKGSSKEENDFSEVIGEKRSVLDRPLPLEKLSGRRHVPVLFTANRIPVLRIKKPQPESLSRYIHKRILQRQKWLDEKARLEIEQKIAVLEDEWDDLLDDLTGKEDVQLSLLGETPDYEASWEDTVSDALWDVHGRIVGEKEQNRVMAKKMQEIVDRERELFEKEKLERRISLEQKAAGQRRLDLIDDQMPEDEGTPAEEGVLK